MSHLEHRNSAESKLPIPSERLCKSKECLRRPTVTREVSDASTMSHLEHRNSAESKLTIASERSCKGKDYLRQPTATREVSDASTRAPSDVASIRSWSSVDERDRADSWYA